jgi:hypothetical protein
MPFFEITFIANPIGGTALIKGIFGGVMSL